MLIPRLQVLAAALLFSTGGVAIKAIAATPWQVACFRAGIAAVTLWVLLPAARGRWGRASVLVGCAYAFQGLAFALANRMTTAANTIFLQSTSPVYVVLLGAWLLKEPARKRDLAILALAVAGLLLIFLSPEEAVATAPAPERGNAIALASGIGWALTVIGLRWIGRDPRNGEGATAVVCGNVIAFAAALPWALPVDAVAPRDILLLAELGVIQLGLSYVCLTAALKHLPALDVSILLLLEPVLSPIWTWYVHQEAPCAGSLIGGAIILGATLLKTLLDSMPARADRP
ncbi:MAG: DMT family transporter [Planctomycetes bacterium]|nr:DMT family transporter [Planctomycetota bacterium]